MRRIRSGSKSDAVLGTSTRTLIRSRWHIATTMSFEAMSYLEVARRSSGAAAVLTLVCRVVRGERGCTRMRDLGTCTCTVGCGAAKE